eukprot:1161895-Pelagomonas_calceolata.AAC.6
MAGVVGSQGVARLIHKAEPLSCLPSPSTARTPARRLACQEGRGRELFKRIAPPAQASCSSHPSTASAVLVHTPP